jgi:hypothetical protein
MAMGRSISGAGEPEPGSGPSGAGSLAGNTALHLIERAMVTALESMEEAEVNLAYHADDLPTTRLEQAVLEARVGALTEELRTLRDAVAKLTGRVEQASEGQRQVDDDQGVLSLADLYRDEAAVARPASSGGVAGKREDQLPISRRVFMASWPGMQACAALDWVEGSDDGRGVHGAVPGRLRAYGFGSIPGAEGRPE